MTVADIIKYEGNEMILFVDDDPGVRGMGVLVLRTLGYTVLHCDDGREALLIAEHLTSQAPDLLVTSITLPGMDGRQLAGQLQAKYPAMRVLYTPDDDDEIIELRSSPPDRLHLLQKPYIPSMLAAKVRRILDASIDDPAAKEP